MELFSKQFVHFMWDKELEGKKVFYADYIDSIKVDVENNRDNHYVTGEGDEQRPFVVDGDAWAFVYYDPNYEIKFLALKGKTIQVLYEGDWTDCNADELWKEGWQDKVFRVSPEESKTLLNNIYVTNRELARWLAQGNGEWARESESFKRCSTDCIYLVKTANEIVEDDILVRKWDDTQWKVPTREYMGLD